MKLQKFLFVSLMIALSVTTVKAQFFESIKKPKSLPTAQKGKSFTAVQMEEAATVKNEFRPVVNLVSTAYQINHRNPATEPGIATLYGAGASYQHLKYNPENGKWVIVWDISVIEYLSTRISGEEMGMNWHGASFGLWDHKINAGIATDLKNIAVTFGIGIPLNNL